MFTEFQGRHFNFFLGGANVFFSMPPDYRKIGKVQHFICSNLTLFIVSFFLSFFFSSFLFFYFFFLFFFFLFPWGGGGDGSPAPSNDAPAEFPNKAWSKTSLNRLKFQQRDSNTRTWHHGFAWCVSDGKNQCSNLERKLTVNIIVITSYRTRIASGYLARYNITILLDTAA